MRGVCKSQPGLSQPDRQQPKKALQGLVESEAKILDPSHGMGEPVFDLYGTLPEGPKQALQGSHHGGFRTLNPLLKIEFHRSHQLGGGRRGRCPKVGCKVGDREIGFMPDRRNDGNLRGEYGPGDFLRVESLEILDGTATPRKDGNVGIAP